MQTPEQMRMRRQDNEIAELRRQNDDLRRENADLKEKNKAIVGHFAGMFREIAKYTSYKLSVQLLQAAKDLEG